MRTTNTQSYKRSTETPLVPHHTYIHTYIPDSFRSRQFNHKQQEGDFEDHFVGSQPNQDMINRRLDGTSDISCSFAETSSDFYIVLKEKREN